MSKVAKVGVSNLGNTCNSLLYFSAGLEKCKSFDHRLQFFSIR